DALAVSFLGGCVVGHESSLRLLGCDGGGRSGVGQSVGGLRVVARRVDRKRRRPLASPRALVPFAVLSGLTLADALELLSRGNHDFASENRPGLASFGRVLAASP